MSNRGLPLISSMLLLTWVLAACAGATSLPKPTASRPASTATKSLPTLVHPATPTYPRPQSVEDRVRLALARDLGVGFDDVQLQVSEEVDWPDSCLGAPALGQACAEVITPGYVGVLVVAGNLYEFHSDRSGENVRFIPGAALSARRILAGQLAVEQSAILLEGFARVDWPDDCLGVETKGQMCAQGVVPGYRVVLAVDGDTYEFHTDEAGGVVRLASAPGAEISQAVVVWSQTGEGLCETATIGADSLLFGSCGGALVKAPFAEKGRAEELRYFHEKYLPFEADTPAGKVSFTGKGLVTATPSEQRMIAEWARLVHMEALSGRAGDSWGLVFAWHREGGSAGLCDDVAVYIDGIAFASSCEGGQPDNLGKTWLTSNQMRTLYTWVDTLRGFEAERSDPATAGAVNIRMVFTGNGQEFATDFEKMRLSSLAEEIAGQLRTKPAPAEIEKARKALEDYFRALSAKQYSAVIALYGGSYQVLQDNNPSITKTDYPALFTAGCSINGFVCDLKIKNFVHETQLSETDFRFVVEMQSPDGSLFVLGPCCGADPQDEPPWTQFDFLVKKTGSRFLVQDLPIFVP